MNLTVYPGGVPSMKRQAGVAFISVVKAGHQCSVCVKGDWKGGDGQAMFFLKRICCSHVYPFDSIYARDFTCVS